MPVAEGQAAAVAEFLGNQRPTTLETELMERRYNIDRNAETIRENERFIANSLAHMREQKLLIDALMESMNNTDYADHLQAQWQILQRHSRLTDARVEGDCFILTTTDDIRITRDDTGDSRWLGRFEITFQLTRRNIIMRNLDTPRGGRDHPHIVDGSPCFGGHGSSFMRLLAAGDFVALFELLIQYLETLNMADEYGAYGAYWFDQEDERPLETAVEEEVAA